MKKAKKILEKFAPALAVCMVFVLKISANSSTCFIFNQPDPPKGLDEFKYIK